MINENTDYAAAKLLSLDDIPIIDLEPLLKNNEIDEAAKQLKSAALNTGFFYVKNHGIKQSVIDTALASSKAFFKLPAYEKTKISVNQQQRGWLAAGMAKFKQAKTHDLKEIFSLVLNTGQKKCWPSVVKFHSLLVIDGLNLRPS